MEVGEAGCGFEVRCVDYYAGDDCGLGLGLAESRLLGGTGGVVGGIEGGEEVVCGLLLL